MNAQYNHEAMLQGYIACALWADLSDDDGEPLDNYSIDDVAEKSISKARENCILFYYENKADIELFMDELDLDESDIGHNLWLTSKGHGTGFWDRASSLNQPEAYEAGKRLSEASKSYEPNGLFIGDDGLVYIE